MDDAPDGMEFPTAFCISIQATLSLITVENPPHQLCSVPNLNATHPMKSGWNLSLPQISFFSDGFHPFSSKMHMRNTLIHLHLCFKASITNYHNLKTTRIDYLTVLEVRYGFHWVKIKVLARLCFFSGGDWEDSISLSFLSSRSCLHSSRMDPSAILKPVT